MTDKENKASFTRKLGKLKKQPVQFIADSIGLKAAKKSANKSSRLFISFHYSIWLLLPISLVFVYLFFIATPQYQSISTLVVKQADDNGLATGSPMAMLGVDTGQNKDAYLVQHYVLSNDMLKYLQQQLNLKQHYADTQADWLSALPTDATQEEILQYYLDKVQVEFDDVSGLLSISVKSFSAEFSQKMVAAMIKHAEQFINELGHKMAQDEVGFVEGELDRAHQKLVEQTEQLTQFQNEKQVFSTKQQSTAVMTSLAELNSLLINKQTELEALLSYMNQSAPEVVTLKNQITALKNQVANQQKRLVGKEQSALNELDIQYRNLTMQIEFSTDVYKAALLGLEKTRAEAHRKLKHLLVVAQPNLADEALYPRRLYWFITISILLMIMYSVVVMLIATVKEHKED